MIINIRGISGSGKSTLARNIMDLYPQRLPVRQKDGLRKQPIGYLCLDPEHSKSLFVVGHYESACGGCDTIHSYPELYDGIFNSSMHHHVLYEGLLISGDVKNTIALKERMRTERPGTPLRNVALAVPLDVCMESVTARRKASWERKGSKGEQPGHMPLERAIAKERQLASAVRRLGEHGVFCEWATRDQAFDVIKGWLGI